MTDAAHLGFDKDTQIIFGSGVGFFASGTKGFEFLMAVGAPDDFGDEPGEFLDGYMFGESMVVNPVWAFTDVEHRLGN